MVLLQQLERERRPPPISRMLYDQKPLNHIYKPSFDHLRSLEDQRSNSRNPEHHQNEMSSELNTKTKPHVSHDPLYRYTNAFQSPHAFTIYSRINNMANYAKYAVVVPSINSGKGSIFFLDAQQHVLEVLYHYW